MRLENTFRSTNLITHNYCMSLGSGKDAGLMQVLCLTGRNALYTVLAVGFCERRESPCVMA